MTPPIKPEVNNLIATASEEDRGAGMACTQIDEVRMRGFCLGSGRNALPV